MTTTTASASTSSSASTSPTSLSLGSVSTTEASKHGHVDQPKVHPRPDKSVSTPSSRSPSRTPSQQRQPTPESPRKCTACTQRRPHQHHNHNNTPDSPQHQQQQHISFGRPTRPLQGRVLMDQDEPMRRPRGNSSSSTAGSRSSSTASSSSSSSNSVSSFSRAPLDRKRPLTSTTSSTTTTTTPHTASVTLPPATERPRWVGAWSTSASSPTSSSTGSPSTCKIAAAPYPSASTHASQQQQQHQRRQSFSSRSSSHMTDHGVDTSPNNKSRHARTPLEEPRSAPFSPAGAGLRATRVTVNASAASSSSSSSSSLTTTATGATTAAATTTTTTTPTTTTTTAATILGARDDLDQDQGKKKRIPTKFARGRSASIAACAKQQQQQQLESLPLHEQQQQEQRHGRPMHESRLHSRHLSTDIKAKDKPMRRGTVVDQQKQQVQQQQQKVRRTAQTEKSNSLVSQGQQQQQQRDQCMHQNAPVPNCQETLPAITTDNLSKDAIPQETGVNEVCQDKAAPMPLVQVAISIAPADDPATPPPLRSPPPVETSPALIRRFLLKEATAAAAASAAASAPSAVATAQPSMPRTTVALSSFENATLTQECISTAAAWTPSSDQPDTAKASSAILQQDESASAMTTTVSSAAVLDPISTSLTPRPLVAPTSSAPQLSAAHIMVSRIVAKSKRRRSLGDLVNIMSKKTREYIPHPRTGSSSGTCQQQDTMATADTRSTTGRRSVSETTPCSPTTHVSTLESFPKHASSSSLRIQYLRDFFRSGPSTPATHARSASVADALIGREKNGRSDYGSTSEERRRDPATSPVMETITTTTTTCQTRPSDHTPATTNGPHRISESASSSRRSSFMALLPGLSLNPPRLWVTTTAVAAVSGQNHSNPATPLSHHSTQQQPQPQQQQSHSQNGSQFSSSSFKTHSTTSSACPSPVLDKRIHAIAQPCSSSSSSSTSASSSNADFNAPGYRDQAMLTLPRPVFCVAQRGGGGGQDYSAGRSDRRPSPLPSLTSVNAIWKDQLVHDPYRPDESYPAQEPNNKNNTNTNHNHSTSNGPTTSDGSQSHASRSRRGSSINIVPAAADDDDNNNNNHKNDARSSSSAAGSGVGVPLETTGRWPWAQLDKNQWNTTFLSAHRGLLLMPPTYSPADEMSDPMAAYSFDGRPQSLLGAAGSSLEDGNCLHLRFGGAATSLESTSLAGSRMSANVYY
ncbi:unnamed protein product [Mortierella alpina]